VPTGDDVVRLGVATPRPFRKNQTQNLESIVQRWGFYNKWDVVTIQLLNKIREGMLLLNKTFHTVNWDNDPDDTGPENNVKFVDRGSGYQGTWAEFWGPGTDDSDPTMINIADLWEAHTGASSNDAPRMAKHGSSADSRAVPDPNVTGGADTVYNYGAAAVKNNALCPLSGTVRFYNYADVDEGITEGTSGCVEVSSGVYVHYDWQFDDMGQDVAYQQWTEWGTPKSVSGDDFEEVVISDALGDTTFATPSSVPMPADCSATYPNSDGKTVWHGWRITNQIAICTWNYDA
jgi:hypothetical protein